MNELRADQTYQRGASRSMVVAGLYLLLNVAVSIDALCALCNAEGEDQRVWTRYYMSILKQVKDSCIRWLADADTVPRGLWELDHYFRVEGPIAFHIERKDDGSYVAVSKDFREGSIITTGRTLQDLDTNLKDAIMTSFAIPSSYAKEVQLRRVGDPSTEYAFA